MFRKITALVMSMLLLCNFSFAADGFLYRKLSISSLATFTEAELETQMGGADVVVVSTDDISSANLATLLSNETGSGLAVFNTDPTLDIGEGKIILPFGTAFPGSPSTNDVFVVTDDSATGACDSSAGSAISLCIYNGASWESLGDGGSGGGGSTIIPLAPYSGKLTGAFITATISGTDTAVSGRIDAGDGNWRNLLDATTDQAVVYWGIIPDNYASTPLCKIPYSMSSATSGTVEFECAIMCVTPGDSADIGTASFAAAGTATETVPGTAGYTSLLSATPTDDSCSPLDIIYVYISTDANDGTNDTATGDREVVGPYIKYTGS